MSGKRERILSEELLSGPTTSEDGKEVKSEYLVTTLSYQLGGMNHFSGGTELRGYYLGVSPEGRQTCTMADGTKYNTKSFTLFAGRKTLVQPAERYSPKVLAALSVPEELVTRLQAEVKAKIEKKIA